MRQISGPWNEATVVRWLTGARIPVRLAVTTARGPLVVSLWYRYDEGQVWCATKAGAAVVTHIRRDPRVGFEIAPDLPPYRGVRGTARATIVPERGIEVLEALLARYLDESNAPLADWLRERSDDEVAIRLDEMTLSSWDFSGRMVAQDGPVLPTI